MLLSEPRSASYIPIENNLDNKLSDFARLSVAINIIGISVPSLLIASSLILSNCSNKNLSITSKLLFVYGSKSSLMTILS